MTQPRTLPRAIVATVAILMITVAAWQMSGARAGLDIAKERVGTTPVTFYHPSGGAAAPVVVIAHGFAGSRQLMEPFAVSLAQSGYIALSFDFLGHGRNPQPMTGDVTREDGATRALVAQTLEIIAYARNLAGASGEVAVLGHSMASDIVVRAAIADGQVDSTIAVSMFSRAVTPEEPRNLLMIAGEWEGFLSREALSTLATSHGPDVEAEQTYGSFASGTARRVVLSDNVEHVSVLYSPESLAAARDWLNDVYGRTDAGPLDVRGPWIVLILIGVVALGWPLASLLPGVAQHAPPKTVSRGRLAAIAVLPAVITPLALWPVPTAFLPVLVADYLAVHFAVYGALTALMLWQFGALVTTYPSGRLLSTAGAASAGLILGLGIPLDVFVANYMPHPGRIPVLAALAIGSVVFTLADQWLVRRPGAPWWLAVLTKLCLVGSLGIAVALDLEELFFLLIIMPVILLFFAIHGLASRWIYGATGHPSVGGIATGIAFGWALGVTFPMLA